MKTNKTEQERKFFSQLFEALVQEHKEYIEMQQQASEEYAAEIWRDDI